MGATVCTSCIAGTYAMAAFGSCLPCSPGSFQPASKSGSCLPCPPNTYSGTAGATSNATCIPCPVDTPFSLSGSSSRSQCSTPSCAPGFWTPPNAVAACAAPCLPGYYCQGGQLIPCERGTARAEEGGTQPASCLPCGPGRFTQFQASATCLPCDAGYIQPLSGQSLCRACPSETYRAELGGNSTEDCLPCPPSMPFAPPASTSLLACTTPPCPAGLYTAPGSVRSCEDLCPTGSFCPPGSVQECPRGTYNSQRGSVTNADCLHSDIGTANPLKGMQACPICEKGQRMRNTEAPSNYVRPYYYWSDRKH
jgi:hypothetical protein